MSYIVETYPIDRFVYVPETKTLVGEASDLLDRSTSVLPVTTIQIVGKRETVEFSWLDTVRDSENELKYWKFRGVDSNGTTFYLTIYND